MLWSDCRGFLVISDVRSYVLFLCSDVVFWSVRATTRSSSCLNIADATSVYMCSCTCTHFSVYVFQYVHAHALYVCCDKGNMLQKFKPPHKSRRPTRNTSLYHPPHISRNHSNTHARMHACICSWLHPLPFLGVCAQSQSNMHKAHPSETISHLCCLESPRMFLPLSCLWFEDEISS